jgi:SPP1 family predicted phage head-tail adaptor
MDAGKLKERVAFDKQTGTPNGRGGTVTTWVEQFACAAQFTYLRGGETVMQGRLTGKQPLVIRVRYSASTTMRATTDWRIRDARKGTVFAIRSIVPVANQWIDITCESGVTP